MKLTDDQKAFLEDKVAEALKDEAKPSEIVKGFVEFVENLEPEVVDPTTTKVKYVGRRPFYEHRDFGVWKTGMVKAVPAPLAAKMLQHPDVYVPADPADVAVAEVTEKEPVKEDDDHMLHDLRDKVTLSDRKKEIVDLIKANFNDHDISTELNVKSKVEDYQRVALSWIDRFGSELKR